MTPHEVAEEIKELRKRVTVLERYQSWLMGVGVGIGALAGYVLNSLGLHK